MKLWAIGILGIGLVLGLLVGTAPTEPQPQQLPTHSTHTANVALPIASAECLHADEGGTAPDPAPAAPPSSVAAPTPAPEPASHAPEETSWVLPLELGWNGAAVGEPIHTRVRFRPRRVLAGDVAFEALITAADGSVVTCVVPVRGLLPEGLAREHDEVVSGDELFLGRAAVMLRVPDAPLPMRVELLRPDGARAAQIRVRRDAGEVTAVVD